MGLVYTNITLSNAADQVRARDGSIAEWEVRQTALTALVDTGSGTLVINEAVREKLGLVIEGLRGANLANNTRQICRVTEPVRIQWKDRDTVCRALVVPGDGDVLLGAIPLEDMDLVVYPSRQELTGAHGDEIVMMLTGIR